MNLLWFLLWLLIPAWLFVVAYVIGKAYDLVEATLPSAVSMAAWVAFAVPWLLIGAAGVALILFALPFALGCG